MGNRFPRITYISPPHCEMQPLRGDSGTGGRTRQPSEMTISGKAWFYTARQRAGAPGLLREGARFAFD